MSGRSVERMDPYGDRAEPAWVGRGAERAGAGEDAPEGPPVLDEVAERYAVDVARELGIEPERVREALRRVGGAAGSP